MSLITSCNSKFFKSSSLLLSGLLIFNIIIGIIFGNMLVLEKKQDNIRLDERESQIVAVNEDNNKIKNNENIPLGSGSRATRSKGSSWLMFKNSPNRLGTSGSTIPNTPNKLWEYQTSPSYASPVVAYDKVYMSSINGYLYCLEETTGNLRWKVQVTQKNGAAVSTPAIGSGNIYVFSSGDGSVNKLNASTGKLLWKYSITGKNSTLNLSYIDQPILLHNGHIFFGAPNRHFYCLDENTGALVWQYETQLGLTYDYGILGGAAANGDYIYFGANDGWLYALDINGFSDGNQGWLLENANKTGATDGDVLWKTHLGDSICSTPVVFNNYVYMSVGNFVAGHGIFKIYRIFCLDRVNGSIIWEYKTNNHIISSPAVVENRIYFGSLDKKIYCLGTSTNTSQWQPVSTDGVIWSSPAVASGKMVIGSYDSNLYCLYTHNGVQVWKLGLNSSITSSPAIANNRVFINTQNGKLHCIGPPDNNPPVIINTTPANDQNNVPVSSSIIVKFNEPLNQKTIISANILLLDNLQNTIPIWVEYDDITKVLKIKPKNYLIPSKKYTFKILTKVTDIAGNGLDGNNNQIVDGSPADDYSLSFTTSSNNPPSLTDAKVTPTVGDLGTLFTFTVLYTDIDNDPPGLSDENIRICIDDGLIENTMKLNDAKGVNETWRNSKYDDGQQYIFTTKLSTLGIHNFSIWCSDGIDWNETKIIGQPILPGPPEIQSIPDLNVVEDIEFTLNLTDYIWDPDTPIEDLTLQINSSYALINGSDIIFLYPNSFNYPSGRNYEYVKISVSDNEFYTSIELKVWVQPENDPPTILSIPNQIVVENLPYPLDLEEYITDIDNTLEELLITENSQFAYIDAQLNLVFNYTSGQTSDSVILSVSDGEFIRKTNIEVSIVSSDVSFVLRGIPDLMVVEDIEYMLDLEKYLFIIQGSIDNLELTTSSNFAKVQGLEITFLYTNDFTYKNKLTSEDITITIKDTEVEYIEDRSIQINVISVNDAPKLINGTVEPNFGNISTNFEFRVNYYDIDFSDNPKVLLVIDGKEFTLNKLSGDKAVYPGIQFSLNNKLDIGYHYFYFSCDDGTDSPNSLYSTDIEELFVTGNLDPYSFYNGFKPVDDAEADFDNDGIPNLWEIQYDMDPTNHSDAFEDFDGDNFNNLLEYLGHDGLSTGNDSTDPRNKLDKPKTNEASPQVTSDRLEVSHWQMIIIGCAVIIIFIILVYYVISIHGVGRLEPATEQSKKISERPDEISAAEDQDTERLEIDEEEVVDINSGSGTDEDIIDISEEAITEEEEADFEVPVTEVDLTEEEKPFLESEELLDVKETKEYQKSKKLDKSKKSRTKNTGAKRSGKK